MQLLFVCFLGGFFYLEKILISMQKSDQNF